MRNEGAQDKYEMWGDAYIADTKGIGTWVRSFEPQGVDASGTFPAASARGEQLEMLPGPEDPVEIVRVILVGQVGQL